MPLVSAASTSKKRLNLTTPQRSGPGRKTAEKSTPGTRTVSSSKRGGRSSRRGRTATQAQTPLSVGCVSRSLADMSQFRGC